MAGYPSAPSTNFLNEPPPAYSPRTPPPQRANIPPAATYVPPTSQQYPSHGGLQGTLQSVGKEVGGVLKGLTKAGVKALNKVLDHPTLDFVKNGNAVQLVSRTTGHALQILQASDGRLVLDGLGGDGHQFINAHFTVIQDTDHHVLFHNNFNYLAIKDGFAQIFSAGPNGVATTACRFKVREVILQNQFVVVESVAERGRYLAALPTGQMKSSLATSPSDNDTHFAIRLIYSPYGPKPNSR